MIRLWAFVWPLVVGAAAFLGARWQSARELGVLRAELASVSSNVEALRAELLEERQHRRALPSISAAVQSRPPLAEAPTEQRAEPPFSGSPESPLPSDDVVEPPTEEETQFALEQAFLLETTDRTFQHRAEAELNEKLGKLAAPSGRATVECRSSLCRASVSLPDEAAYQAFLARIVASRSLWQGEANFRVQRSNGRVEFAAFFAKDGAALPLGGH